MIVIRDASAEFIREPLLAPFGFKGNHVDELWQSVVRAVHYFNLHTDILLRK